MLNQTHEWANSLTPNYDILVPIRIITGSGIETVRFYA